MRRTTLFRQYINEPEILILPGVHDTLTARIMEKAGFKALTVGGYSVSATLLGKPDVSLLTLTEMVDHIGRIAGAVEIPLLADGDTGHGGVLNVQRMVKKVEACGAGGVFIEDQQFPKRCGHMQGKQVVDREEMTAKLKAALDARQDKDFIIMARTDALAVNGLDDAIERANLFREIGADLIFIEAPTSIEQMERINREVQAPTMANNIEGGKTPLLPAKELEKIGYNVVTFPVAMTYAVAEAATDLAKEMLRTGTTDGYRERMSCFDEFNELVGLSDLRAKEAGFYK